MRENRVIYSLKGVTVFFCAIVKSFIIDAGSNRRSLLLAIMISLISVQYQSTNKYFNKEGFLLPGKGLSS